MPSQVFSNAQVLINAVDLSAKVKEVRFNYKAELQDSTTMGDGTRERMPGLKDWDFDITFQQDYAAGSVDATLFPLIGAAAFSIEVRPVSGARSLTNPGYTGSCVMESYDPAAGSLGEIQTCTGRFVAASALARQTS